MNSTPVDQSVINRYIWWDRIVLCDVLHGYVGLAFFVLESTSELRNHITLGISSKQLVGSLMGFGTLLTRLSVYVPLLVCC